MSNNRFTIREEEGEIRTKPIPPDLDGTLSKLKHKTSLFGSWSTRYFRINQKRETLEYFRSKAVAQEGAAPSGSLNLLDLTAIRRFDNNSFQIEAGSDVYLLSASSIAEQSCWVTALEEYLVQKQDYDRWNSAYQASQREALLEQQDKRK